MVVALAADHECRLEVAVPVPIGHLVAAERSLHVTLRNKYSVCCRVIVMFCLLVDPDKTICLGLVVLNWVVVELTWVVFLGFSVPPRPQLISILNLLGFCQNLLQPCENIFGY